MFVLGGRTAVQFSTPPTPPGGATKIENLCILKSTLDNANRTVLVRS